MVHPSKQLFGRSVREIVGAGKQCYSPADAHPVTDLIGKNTIERTMEALAFVCTNTDNLLRLSSELNVSQAFWNIDGTLPAKIGQFVAQVAGMGRLEALVEAVAIQYPQLLQ
jgi:hypothetical protein